MACILAALALGLAITAMVVDRDHHRANPLPAPMHAACWVAPGDADDRCPWSDGPMSDRPGNPWAMPDRMGRP